MSNRAVQEQLGGGINVGATSGTYRLRRPSGPGGARAYLWEWTGAGTIVLPDATDMQAGTSLLMISHPDSTDAPNIDTYGGVTTGTLSVGFAIEYTLVAPGTESGVWVGKAWIADIGAAPVNTSNPVFDFTISTTTFDFDLLAELVASYGYDGVTPCEVTVHIAPGIVVGCTQTTGAAFSTIGMPSGSSLVIDLQAGAYISGKGGRGGNGQDLVATTSSDGIDGSPGLRTTIDTALVGAGTVQGGGGGGGGGGASGGFAGSSGGGGCGWVAGPAGAVGTGGSTPPSPGQSGTLLAGGAGGSAIGGPSHGATGAGAGGGPGTDGAMSFGSHAGGSAGDAVIYTSGITYDKSGFSGSVLYTETAV